VEAAKKVGPAVVTVVNTLQTGRTQRTLPTALGSGVIIDQKGYIVTNNHVIENQRELTVIFADGRRAKARIIGTDTLADLAVIKVDEPVPAVAEWGDSDTLVPGQRVLAIGSALGNFRNSVTAGVVSGLGRDLPGVDYSLQDLIQTDAPINHGNSGGPLVNLAGQVVGINAAIYRGSQLSADDTVEGVGFAIPSNTARAVAEQLIRAGKVTRPYLGVSYQPLTPQAAVQLGISLNQGAYILDVRPNTPAARAGLQEGDIIIAVNESALDDTHNLQTVLLRHKVGETVTLSVRRGDTTLTVHVTLAERPTDLR
jgi:2-alkenal reductase